MHHVRDSREKLVLMKSVQISVKMTVRTWKTKQIFMYILVLIAVY
jgi:hypothetical protein